MVGRKLRQQARGPGHRERSGLRVLSEAAEEHQLRADPLSKQRECPHVSFAIRQGHRRRPANRSASRFAVDENLSGPRRAGAARRAARASPLTTDAVDPELMRLCVLAHCRRRARATCSRPTSHLERPEQNAIADLIPDQPFIRTAPVFVVFLANGRRLAEISKMRGKPFPNDHLDQFFNAAVDAGIVLATFMPRPMRWGSAAARSA